MPLILFTIFITNAAADPNLAHTILIQEGYDVQSESIGLRKSKKAEGPSPFELAESNAKLRALQEVIKGCEKLNGVVVGEPCIIGLKTESYMEDYGSFGGMYYPTWAKAAVVCYAHKDKMTFWQWRKSTYEVPEIKGCLQEQKEADIN